jgi:tRNA (Thr-GGU) A37 N-methylase
MTSQVALTPIGIVRSPVTEPLDDVWGGVISSIDSIGPAFNPGARHPRGRTDWPKTGVLAQRAKNRPNRIGVTVCHWSKPGICQLSWKVWTRSTARPFLTSSPG